MRYEEWLDTPAGIAAQAGGGRARRKGTGKRTPRKAKPEVNANARDRLGCDPRAHQAWCYRGKDGRWRVYHRCHYTGKMGEPIKCGRGRKGQDLAEFTVRIMQARGLQIATEIQDVLR